MTFEELSYNPVWYFQIPHAAAVVEEQHEVSAATVKNESEHLQSVPIQ